MKTFQSLIQLKMGNTSKYLNCQMVKPVSVQFSQSLFQLFKFIKVSHSYAFLGPRSFCKS